MVAANHFISEEMSCYNAGIPFSSDKRYQTAYNTLKNADTGDGIELAQSHSGRETWVYVSISKKS